MGIHKTALFKPTYWVLVSMLIVCLAYVHWPGSAQEEKQERFLSSIPFQFNGWESTKEIILTQKEKNALGAEDYLLRWYKQGHNDVLLYIAFFSSKHGNITHNPEKCYPGSGFHITRRAILECSNSESDAFPVIRIVPIRDNDKQLVLYWFQEGNQVIVSKWAHVREVLTKAILYNRTESFMVRVSMPFTTDEEMEGKTSVLEEFAGGVRLEILKALKDANSSSI